MSPETVATRLKAIVGANGYSEDQGEIAPHLTEWRGKYHGRSPLLLKPRSALEVSSILALCHETSTPVVPQGGNTGLVGGQIPFDGEILLSLSRMSAIRSIDADGMHMVAEAGVILADAQAAVERCDRYFPLSLAAEGSCTIGGNVATNAGGINVLRYGSARELVLGLEVVLADGRVLEMLRTLRKDNTGYDLKQLFIGAEGTLGVITAASLKLFPRLRVRSTALVAIPSPAAALALLSLSQQATGGTICAFELIPRIALSLVLQHIPGSKDPLPTKSPWYALVEAASPGELPLGELLQSAVATAIEKGSATDAVFVASEGQRQQLWNLRENISEAQKLEGASIKHDISVPLHVIPEFIEKGAAAVAKAIPGVRLVAFGHVGDGNLHFNFSAPPGSDEPEFLARWSEIARIVHDLVHAYDGSISAEHGIGVMKRDEITRYKSQFELELMHGLKQLLDPRNILNPGKVLRS